MSDKKFYVETFGCQMNVADSEEMGRYLLARGFTSAAQKEEADWILINTCTVRQHAEHKALSYMGRLQDWKRGKPGRRIVVAGCAAERLQDALLSRFPHVDLVVGAKSIGRFPELADPLLPASEFDGLHEFRDTWSPENNYALLPRQTVTAFVTIMRGCNYSCAYCIVPAVRGREIYRPAASVLAEVRQKAGAGLSEVMLLGQTVNSYRPEDAGEIADFSDLLRAVDAVPGVRRIRFMSPHPFYMTDKMVQAMAECGNICRHIHLPVQSGSDDVLKRMRRNYTREDYLKRVEKLRRAAPGIAVTTDLIAGFPGETERDFEATLSLIQEADFDGAFCFKYSPRPGTEAARLKDDVPRDLKEERHARLLKLAQELAARKVAALKGSRQEVLIERVTLDEGPAPVYEGKNRSTWNIRFTSDRPRRAGDTVLVDISEVTGRTPRGHESALQ